MILFPEIVLKLLIYGSLTMAGIGLIVLLTLLWRDRVNKSIW